MTPKDWNTQEEAIAAAKAEILAAIGDTDARLELGMVKSVQRGNAATNINTGNQVTVKISEVDMDKSIVIASFFNSTPSGNDNFGGVISLTSPTTLNINAAAGSGSNYTSTSVRWQVIEFY